MMANCWVVATSASARSREPCRMRKVSALTITTSPGVTRPADQRWTAQASMAAGHDPERQVVDDPGPLEVQPAPGLRPGLGPEQPGEAAALPLAGREGLDRPDVRDRVDQLAADPPGPLGVGAVEGRPLIPKRARPATAPVTNTSRAAAMRQSTARKTARAPRKSAQGGVMFQTRAAITAPKAPAAAVIRPPSAPPMWSAK